MRTIPAPATAAHLRAAGQQLDGCSKSEHAATADPVPLEFPASYTRFRGAAVQVEMRDAATVIYRRGERGFAGGPDAREEVVTVSAAQWARFRIRIDLAKLTEWKEACRDPSLADGEWWQVRLRYADFSAESMGANVFPEHGADDEFTRAMHELTGNREFP